MTPKYLPGTEPDQVRPLLNIFLEEIDSTFPDKKVDISKWNHERWDKPAQILCDFLGYERGRDFLTAYGYLVLSEDNKPKNTTAEVIKAAAISAMGENNVNELTKYGKTATEIGKKTAQAIGDIISTSDNESVKLVRDIVNEIKGDSSKKQIQKDYPKEKLRLQKVLCPNCGASLNVENGIDTFYCQYCGTRVVIDNQSEATIKAKETVKKLQHREVIADKLINHFNSISEKKAEEAKRRHEFSKKILPILLALFVICMIFLFSMIKKEDHDTEKEEIALQAVLEEVQQDISMGKYDEAWVKANTIYFTSSSGETRKKWDNTRKALLKQIESLQEEKKQSENVINNDDTGEAVAQVPADTIQESNTEISTAQETQKKSNADYHSSGDRKIARDGNTGVYAYSIYNSNVYYIVDFDEGYVYRYTTDETSCYRMRIESGTLKTALYFYYHIDGNTYPNNIHFVYTTNPEHAILIDEDGFDWDLHGTNLQDALEAKDSKTIEDY